MATMETLEDDIQRLVLAILICAMGYCVNPSSIVQQRVAQFRVEIKEKVTHMDCTLFGGFFEQRLPGGM
jgi:hypothetical protein